MTIAQRREVWASALESGEYSQGRGRLKPPEGFCCLGVACDLFPGEGEWRPEGPAPAPYSYFLMPTGEKYSTFMPPEVAKMLGISENGEYILESLSEETFAEVYNSAKNKSRINNNLAAINDAGVPFSVIAKVIREATFLN